jgi:hypothetical protein
MRSCAGWTTHEQHRERMSLTMPEQYRRCQTCSAEKPVADFNRPAVKPFGRARVCAACAKEWRRTPAELARKAGYYAKYPKRVRASIEAYRARHVEELRIVAHAGVILREALKRGQITKPVMCEACGAGDRRIEAAHHDYSRPLDVRWLCKPCHGRWDRAEPKIMGRLSRPA